MGFVVLPALIPDITPVYDVYFAAFENNPVTRAFFPHAKPEELVNPASEFRYIGSPPLPFNISTLDHITDHPPGNHTPATPSTTGKTTRPNTR